MLIRYLIQNRSRPALATREWWKSWAKRLRLLLNLFVMELRLQLLCNRGARIGPLTSLSPSTIAGKVDNLKIGSGCAIGRVTIQLHDRVEIGNNVVINDGAKLLTGSHNVHSATWELVTHPIRINDYAWVATGTMILPGVEIGRGAVVAAGAVVSRTVAPLEIVAGNPAVPIGMRSNSELSYEPSRHVAVFEAWLGKTTT